MISTFKYRKHVALNIDLPTGSSVLVKFYERRLSYIKYMYVCKYNIASRLFNGGLSKLKILACYESALKSSLIYLSYCQQFWTHGWVGTHFHSLCEINSVCSIECFTWSALRNSLTW